MKLTSQRLSLFLIISAFLSSQNSTLNCDLSEVATPVEITTENFENEVLMADMPVILEIYAPWCEPCQPLKPIIQDLCQEFSGKIKFATLNADQNPELAEEMGAQYLPTFFIFYKGELFAEIEGAGSKEEFTELCEEILAIQQEIDQSLQA